MGCYFQRHYKVQFIQLQLNTSKTQSHARRPYGPKLCFTIINLLTSNFDSLDIRTHHELHALRNLFEVARLNIPQCQGHTTRPKMCTKTHVMPSNISTKMYFDVVHSFI